MEGESRVDPRWDRIESESHYHMAEAQIGLMGVREHQWKFPVVGQRDNACGNLLLL